MASCVSGMRDDEKFAKLPKLGREGKQISKRFASHLLIDRISLSTTLII